MNFNKEMWTNHYVYRQTRNEGSRRHFLILELAMYKSTRPRKEIIGCRECLRRSCSTSVQCECYMNLENFPQAHRGQAKAGTLTGLEESNFVPDGWLDDDPTPEVEVLISRSKGRERQSSVTMCIYLQGRSLSLAKKTATGAACLQSFSSKRELFLLPWTYT